MNFESDNSSVWNEKIKHSAGRNVMCVPKTANDERTMRSFLNNEFSCLFHIVFYVQMDISLSSDEH